MRTLLTRSLGLLLGGVVGLAGATTVTAAAGQTPPVLAAALDTSTALVFEEDATWEADMPLATCPEVQQWWSSVRHLQTFAYPVTQVVGSVRLWIWDAEGMRHARLKIVWDLGVIAHGTDVASSAAVARMLAMYGQLLPMVQADTLLQEGSLQTYVGGVWGRLGVRRRDAYSIRQVRWRGRRTVLFGQVTPRRCCEVRHCGHADACRVRIAGAGGRGRRGGSPPARGGLSPL